jgi:N-acetylglucosamine kinase-like BadF-type ATPase/DNA-binding XRE family transcriptional regulator
MFETSAFAANLRAARKRKGLSQRQLAQRLFLCAQAVSKWEKGESLPDIPHLCALAQVLQQPVDALLGITPAGEPALIAVDAGGTKTEFVRITPAGRLCKRVVLDGANPNTCGVEAACEIFRKGIDALLEQDCAVLAVYIGGAGMASAGNADKAEAILRRMYPGLPIQCRSDISNVHALARDPENAIAVICGTGSVVYATRDGVLHRAGGAGWKLETLGSGYDMGRQTIHAALEYRDGTGPATALTLMVERKLGGKVWDSIGTIYGETPAFIASFAPLALDAWQQADPVATQIVLENARRLAHLINTAADKAPKATQVLLGGSLFLKNEAFRNEVARMLAPRLRADVYSLPQIWGACLCCAKLAGLPAPDVNTFMDAYLQEE